MISVLTRIVVQNESDVTSNMIQNQLEILKNNLKVMNIDAEVSLLKTKIKASKSAPPMIRKVKVEDLSKVEDVKKYFELKGCTVSIENDTVIASKINGRGGFHKMALAACKIGGTNSCIVE